uniref:ubiquitinyl hydrolase 1 n=1 Tax=Oncorhynchus mykiss TaxID=8022 RepID=A0A8K9XFN0_ONCMY
MLQTFFGTLLQICASTQSCFGGLQTIPSASWLVFFSDIRYMSRLSRSECLQELPVICMGSSYDRLLKVNHLKPVTAKEAELLQALGEDSERLKWYLERDALATALGLTKDTPVTVELDGKWLQGIVRYIGRLTEPKFTDPIVGTFFGIELQGEDKGKGPTDGTYLSKTLFSCKKDCGIFAPFSRVKPMFSKPKLVSKCLTFPAAQLATQPSSQQAHHQPLSTGDRVTFFMDEDILHGMVMDLEEKEGKTLVIISTVSNSLTCVFCTHSERQALRSPGALPSSPIASDQVERMLIGRMKGIQGHINSCYMDSALFRNLKTRPVVSRSAGGKVQDSYCYQIFLDNNHSLVLPTVQHLLEHSFHSAGLKLAEVPSCLILQMPRFGKKFKMFQKIIPSLELDITDLLSEGPQQCVLCGQLAYEECVDCFRDPVFSRTGFKVFCRTCSSQVHSHPERLSHSPSPLQLPEGYPAPTTLRAPHPAPPRERLELFAVLCIETSHYVSFIKHGPNSTDWIFFDSMADRHGERDGFNIPQVEACPEVGMYLVMSPAELANQVPRDMKGVAKRLFCDAYMYLYQSTSISLYR